MVVTESVVSTGDRDSQLYRRQRCKQVQGKVVVKALKAAGNPGFADGAVHRLVRAGS